MMSAYTNLYRHVVELENQYLPALVRCRQHQLPITVFVESSFAKCAIIYPVYEPSPLKVITLYEPSVATVGEPVVVPE